MTLRIPSDGLADRDQAARDSRARAPPGSCSKKRTRHVCPEGREIFIAAAPAPAASSSLCFHLLMGLIDAEIDSFVMWES